MVRFIEQARGDILVPSVRPCFTGFGQNINNPCTCSLYRAVCAWLIDRFKVYRLSKPPAQVP